MVSGFLQDKEKLQIVRLFESYLPVFPLGEISAKEYGKKYRTISKVKFIYKLVLMFIPKCSVAVFLMFQITGTKGELLFC